MVLEASLFWIVWLAAVGGSYSGVISFEGSSPDLDFVSSQRYELCTTQECKDAAETLKMNMNLSADPCEDFFEFTCGGWSRRHPVPKTESHWNQFNLVDEKLSYQIRDILEEPIHPDDLQSIKNAKAHYTACMNTKEIEREGLKPLVGLLSELGGWPMAQERWSPGDFDWQKTLARVTSLLGVSPLLFIYVYADRKNSSHSVLTIDQPSLVIPRSMLLDPDTYRTQTEAYRLWILEAAYVLAKHTDQNIAKEHLQSQAEEVVQFESEIARITSPNEMRRNGFRTYNGMTLRQLQTWTDTASPKQIDWLELVNDILDGSGIQVGYTERIVVREVDYVFNLAKLLQETPARIIANYLYWRIVKTFSRDLNEMIRHLAFNFDQVFTGATQDHPRWRECIYSTNSAVSMAVGYSYVQKHFDDSDKKTALEMSENIKSIFSEEMSKVSWMDEATRSAAREKVDSMSHLIGYPHWFNNKTSMDLYYRGLDISDKHFRNVIAARRFAINRMLRKLKEPTDRKEWPISPAVVNAYYNPQINSIIFPAGILQTPFFSRGRIEALNYGGIGVVIAHEITHGFDDVGRQSDSLGNLAQWWSENTIETYLQKAQCFINQYGAFRVPQLDKILSTSVTVNGVTTLGENIADNGGLHSALIAYKKYVTLHGEEPRLPGLEQFSPEQLFYIAFATNWCESTTKESLLHEILNDPHSPHKFRVSGSLANSPNFARTFNCPPPKAQHICKIW